MDGGKAGRQIISENVFTLGGAAGQHQRGPDLIGGVFVRARHFLHIARGRLIQADFGHDGGFAGLDVRFEPGVGLQHQHRVVAAQPGDIQPVQDGGQPRTGRHPRQPFGDSLPFDNHTVKLPTTTDKNAPR
ncbi:hypothetical protein [Planotetraspora sp. GP83]|uniref:hypothetical protein n=1 Tax=Planotetraspora sp. GP83 TaxID=3156264 RepID=UPI0035175619